MSFDSMSFDSMSFESLRFLRMATSGGGNAEPVERADIPDRYKWKLEKIFPDWDAWDAACAEVEQALPALANLQGTLAHSGPGLLKALTQIHTARRVLEKALVFAGMKSDEDTRVSENIARRGRVSSLAVNFSEAVSWYDAELLAAGPERLVELTEEEPELELFAHHFDDIMRARDHTLPAEQEALMAASGLMARGASQVFNAFDNADLVFPPINDENGESTALTKGRYSKFLKSGDRRVREDAYTTFLDAYGGMRNTLAANMDANVKNHLFYAKARRHPGCLEAALHPDGVPPAVFHSLLETVDTHQRTIHRYTELKKKVLGLDPLQEYDLAMPLFPGGEFKFDYDEACGVLLEAFAPLGGDYVDTVRSGIDEGWIDVHESLGKRSGGYSNGVYDTPPYILLNWADQLGDTFTLAHELGHSMHSWLAARHQPYVYGDYPIFTAEVASTFNELLLMHHLLEQNQDKQRLLYLLDYHLAQINNTVFRQTMFAEFEHRIHLEGEAGETLTADGLGELYEEMLAKYWGPAATFDPERSHLTWCRIPHFFYNFYVYQYATAYAAAVALSRRVLAGGETEREQYLDILRSGSSRYPVETIALGGVDLSTAKPMEDVVDLFGSLIDRLESLLD